MSIRDAADAMKVVLLVYVIGGILAWLWQFYEILPNLASLFGLS